MKHIVLFKFETDIEKNVVENLFKETYDSLKNEFKVVENYELFFNCLKKDSNEDLALFVYLNKKEDLDAYIMHEKHQEFLKKTKSLGVIKKSVIDI